MPSSQPVVANRQSPSREEGCAVHQFRLAMRRLAATVSVVTTLEDGIRYGMTATSVVSVSMEPPSLLVSINRGASIHDPLLRRGRFCVNLLLNKHQLCSDAFAGKLTVSERFDVGTWHHDHELPFLADALANVFCMVDRTLEYGSHTIVIGRVLDARVAHPIEPLIHLDGACQALGADTARVSRPS
jgi:flavin reductase (DIM6/NTAB) family NADH-FMN oxidoreductase RutF